MPISAVESGTTTTGRTATGQPAIMTVTEKRRKAQIEHKVRGRIRVKVPSARLSPDLLECYRKEFLTIPGLLSVKISPESGSIIFHYDPKLESEFEQHFASRSNQHLMMVEARPGDDIADVADRIEAEAELLAAHSSAARATVDFFKSLDRELRLLTDNTIDLKVLVAAGLAAYAFIKVGVEASTPIWVTLALFAFNHFIELQGGRPVASASAVAHA